MAEPKDQLPEPDRLEGAPHPRETRVLFGHSAAEVELLRAQQSGRMHHAWMLTGPKGVGKATLAWRAFPVRSLGRSSYIPLFAYEGEKKYRAARADLVAQN